MSLTTAAVSVEEASNMQVKATLLDKTTKDKEDEVEGSNVAVSMEVAEFGDPAILMVRSAATSPSKYTKEELLKLKDAPMSKKRPEFLNPAYDNANGIWDPERWHYDLKTSETPTENGSRTNDVDNHRRRSGDPRERLRKEQDGIVLSPQRRSFNSGCFVPVREPARANRSHSPHGKAEPAHIIHREIPQGPGPRRIGSGRILPWETEGRWDKTEPDGDFNFRRERRDTDRERDERFDRRSFGREVEINRQKEKDRDRPFPRNGRYNERRRDNREEEPEWFSEGPMSQHDTIELRGFDESEKITTKKKQTPAQKKRAKERTISVKNLEVQSVAEKDETPAQKDTAPTPRVGAPSEAPPKPKSPVPDLGGAGDAPPERKVESGGMSAGIPGAFNLEDFLKSDTIPGLLTNGVGLEGGEATGSKFSRWFKREKSPPNVEESRRSSLQDDHHHLIKNILNDISEPNVTIPGDSESYFAPISPAASTGILLPQPPASKPINLVEMLQRGKQQVPLHGDVPPSIKTMEVPGKVLSLEELEAQMLQGGGGDMGGSMGGLKHSKGEEDVSAFKRLLAQVCGGHAIPASNGPIPPKTQPMSILEMLTHSQKQDEAARLAQLMSSSNPPPPHLTNDLTYKLQQQHRQYDILSKLINAGNRPQQRSPPLPDMGISQSRELLNRPEAQAILQGLKRGDITPQHLYQQLANPAMQSRHRELLQMILKLQVNTGVGPSPRVLSPVPPPHHLFQQQQQQLRVSPLPPNAMHQRIPSPRELQVHTQNIMQRALIKKKLEEQQENYRKKQEMQQRGQSPGRGVSPAKHVSSPTQLAFTPTSVLRKMTAEKDDCKDPNKNADALNKMPQGRAVTGMRSQTQAQQQSQQQWNNQFQQMNKQPAGRPIVKNNANFQQTQPHDQFLQQQQRLYGQQRKQSTQYGSGMSGQFGGPSFNPNQQPFSQLTQHQMRAQHQQQQHARAQHQQQQQQQHQGFGQHQWQQILHNQNFDNRQMGGRGGTDGGDMSPTTTNQLTRWFSPELLERARKGKLPTMPPSNLAQHALSLEEIERQTTPAIHN